MEPAELEDILSTVRRFVRQEVVPAEAAIDEQDEIPARIRERAADMGLYGFALPVEHGGLGLTMSEEVLLTFELGYTTPAFRSLFGTNNGIAGHVLIEGGTDRQRETLLPRLASGEWTASFALTEPDAGSDPTALTTRARRDDGGWVIDGSKRFITNAPTAEVFMVFARTSTEARPVEGISVFLVEQGADGLSVAPRDGKMGQHGAWTADVHLDGVRVSDEALIGAEGAGWTTAMRCLAHGRLHIAALCVGQAQRLVDESASWALERRQGGKAIAEHQLVQAMLADSQVELMASRALVVEAARAFDAGEDRKLGPAAAKLYVSEALGRIADRAVQIHGGSGYIRGVPVERMYRDVRVFRIYEGTSQVLQMVVARELLKGYAG